MGESKFKAPTDPEKLIMWLDEKRKAGQRELPDRQLKLNLAYVLGHQWLTWDESKRVFVRPRARPDDPNAPIRLTVNKIGGIAERFIARLVKAAPEPETRPVTDDESDVNAAKAGTRILRSELNRLDWESFLVRHAFWPVTHGWAYTQIMWDPKAGRKIGTIDKDTNVYEGQITLESVPAFELVVDPDARSMQTALWAIRTRSMTRAAIWEHWGVEPVSDESGRTLADEVNDLAAASSRHNQEDRLAVHQFWMVPCRAAPKGLVVTWCGQTILEKAKDFPYKHGRLPFVQWDLLPGLGQREGRTWMNDLISLQADYNDARSREAALRRTLTPKIVVAQGSGVDPKSLTSRLEVIDYNPVAEPPRVYVPDSGWMAQHETAMNRNDGEMGDRAGSSDVSSGKPSSASMPAAAILALQEADDTKMAISYKLMSDAIKDVAWHMLMLVQQFWTEDRLVRTWSEEGAIEVRHFSQADVQGQLDVHVYSETGVVRSKSAMVQLALDLWSAQVITDPRHLLRLIKVPGTDFLAEVWNVDTRQAQRENEHLQLGEMVQVNSFDNHPVHIAEHDAMRKGEEYEKLAIRAASGDPEAVQIKAAIDAHVDLHQQMVLPKAGLPDPRNAEAAQASPLTGPEGAFPNEPYIDPLTGLPPNPTQVAAGAAPSALSDSSIRERAGIGGPGNPGAVPGVDPDAQAASMGA